MGTDKRVAIGVTAAVCVVISGWLLVFHWLRPAPLPPESPQMRVTGYAAKSIRASSVELEATLCAPVAKDKGLKAAAQDLERQATQAGVTIARSEIDTDEDSDDKGNDKQRCRTLTLTSDNVDAALKLYRELRLKDRGGDVTFEVEGEPECKGEVVVTEAARATESAAIADAQQRLEALATAAHAHIGELISSEVSSTASDGSWGMFCTRVVTATATIAVKPR